MSGDSEQLDFDRELFNLCADRPVRKLYVEAWVIIRQGDGVDRIGLYIDQIEHIWIKLGNWESDEALKEELWEVELDPTLTPGCYVLQGLFDVKKDSDDYRFWYYLEENIVEFEFICTIDEHENPVSLFEPTGSDLDFLQNGKD